MLKKVLILILFILIFPGKVFATGNFSSGYDVTINVLDNGTADVLEKITLKNLTKDYYPDNVKVSVNSPQISDITALDSTGAPLAVSVERVGNGSQIAVRFTRQVIGLNKESLLNLSFNSKDFVQKHGRVWEVKFPKIPSDTDLDGYNLNILVPASFGPPDSIKPKPIASPFKFDKSQLLKSGVVMIFGRSQLFDFNLAYNLQNNGFLPVTEKLILPPSTDYQDVFFQDIQPRPINVTTDADGNFLAWYKLKPKESLGVNVTGSSRLYLNSKVKTSPLPDLLRQRYTGIDRYWGEDFPQIANTLSNVLGQNPPTDTTQKAQLIYNYALNSANSDPATFFIALCRAANIPTRELNGVLYNGISHSWAEYFDEKRGWVMIDPLWELDSGVNYFDSLDLDRLIFSIKSTSASAPKTGYEYPTKVGLTVGQNDFPNSPQIDVQIINSNPIWAGIPTKAEVKITNTGNIAMPASSFKVASDNLTLFSDASQISIIPSFGYAIFPIDLKSQSLFDSFFGVVNVTVGKQNFTRQVTIAPFIIFQTVPFVSIIILLVISLVYFIILGVFIYRKRFLKTEPLKLIKKKSKKKNL